MTDLPSPAVTWLATEWKYLLALSGGVGCCFWVWTRTRSTHIFFAILWRKLLGDPCNANGNALSAFFEERSELMRFRALTGLHKTPTLAAAQRIVKWTSDHDLDIDLVAAAGLHVDLHQPAVAGRRPSDKSLRLVDLVTGVFLLGLAMVIAVGTTLKPVVRVVQSDKWYEVGERRAGAFALWGRTEVPKFSLKQCEDQSAIVARTGYAEHDVSVLCQVMGGEGAVLLSEARNGQLILTALAAFVLACILLR